MNILAYSDTEQETGHEGSPLLEVSHEEVGASVPDTLGGAARKASSVGISRASGAANVLVVLAIDSFPVDTDKSLTVHVLEQDVASTERERNELEAFLDEYAGAESARGAK